MGLRVSVGAVGAADRLEEGVVAERLVEVHRLEDRRVEARQQLGRDDEDLERIGRIAEAFEEFFLRITLPVVFPVFGKLRPLLPRH